VPVVGTHSFTNLIGITNFAIALKADGSAWAWGLGTTGELGEGNVLSRSSPVSVVGAHSFISITNYNSTSITALKADGSVWGWGAGASGVLGNNSIANRSSPVSVVGNHSFVSFVANYAGFSNALKADGSVWAWGTETTGSLGNNNSNLLKARSSPVSVIGGNAFIGIYAGHVASGALKSDGTVWTWGLNTSGVLGNNSDTSHRIPTEIVGNHTFVAVSAGRYHFIALKSDGSIWGWGQNTNGQLGVDDILNRSSPVPVIGAHSFIAITCGEYHSAALKSNGTCWIWGFNTSGQVGDNTMVDRSSPVLVIGPA
jgi:alpha-tubulin suppressor-like RCC1 family protein